MAQFFISREQTDFLDAPTIEAKNQKGVWIAANSKRVSSKWKLAAALTVGALIVSAIETQNTPLASTFDNPDHTAKACKSYFDNTFLMKLDRLINISKPRATPSMLKTCDDFKLKL